jgi:hypothetical protein
MSDMGSFGEEPRVRSDRPRHRPPSMFWPLMLISAGVLLLLSNLGYLPWESWNAIWKLWPLMLIAMGIDVLVGRRSTLGAIISALLILGLIGGAIAVLFFAQSIPGLEDLTQRPPIRLRHIVYELGDVESATVEIDWSSIPGYLSALDDSPNLIEGDVAYRGDLIFDVHPRGDQVDVVLDSFFAGTWTGPLFGPGEEYRWDVKLSPNVPIDLTLDGGSGSCDYDLAGLQISDLVVDVGSGSVDLVLPAGSSFAARIDGGSGSMDVVLPEGVGARVALESGSGSFDPGERLRLVAGERDDDGVWETDDYDGADFRIELMIDQGSGSIHFR